jgi:hypothetical protein
VVGCTVIHDLDFTPRHKYLEDVAELGLKVCVLRYVREIEGRLSPHEQSNELVGYGGNILWQNDVINSLYGFS